jgi:PAS domain S-box-containing protein
MKLRSRISLIIVGFTVVVGVEVTLAVMDKFQEEYRLDVRDWFNTLSTAVDRAIVHDLRADNYAAVREYLQGIVRDNHSIQYLLLLDAHGQLVTSSDDAPRVVEFSRQAGRYCGTGEGLSWQFGGQTIDHFCKPMLEKAGLQLHIGLNESHLGHFFQRAFLEIGLILLPIMLLAIIAAFVVAARVSRSLQWLAASVQAYGRSGEFPQREAPRGETEIRQLHASIVDMVAERNAAEKDLRLKDAAVRHSLNAIAIGDLDGRLVYVNPAFLRLWGYDREDQVLGRPATEFWVRPEEAGQVVEALLGEGTWQGEMCARRHGGGEFVANLCGVLLRDARGEPSHILGSFLDVTQQHQAEQALQEHVARLQEAQRIAHIGSWELDLTTNALHWSDEIFRIFEIDPRRFGASYEAFLNAIHPDDRERVNQAYTASLAERSPYEIIHRLQMADGRIKYVNERCESFFDAAGKPLLSKGTVQDISEQRKAELELKALTETLEQRVAARTDELQAERNFINTVLDTAGALVTVLDSRGHVVRFNRACEEVTGFKLAELHHRPLWEVLVPAAERAEVEGIFRRLHATGEASRHENHWLTKDGRQRLIAWSNSVIRDERGGAAYSIGTGIDITARHQAEQALAQSERLLREAQTIARIGHWRANLQTGELIWSDEIYNIFGRDPAAFEPSIDNFFACVHADDVALMQAANAAADTPGGKLSVDHRILLPDGNLRWVHEEAVTEPDAAGRPLHLTGTVQDISEHKRVEAELLAAKEEAERANHAKSDFLSRMSHELRTPMNAILGFAQLLELEPLLEDQLRFAQEIHLAGKHLLELINELLDLSRIESGRLITVVRAVALQDAMQQALQIVAPMLTAHSLSLDNGCRDEVHLLADATRLKQVLVNLLSNAVKYNREGGSIAIRCEVVAGGEAMRVSITDTGAGIPAEHMPNLFVPFERLGAEFTEVDGTGIGLALCRQIMELMGGRIGADSVLGKGSTFWFELPLAPAHVPLAETPAAAPLAAPDGDRQILYVEDNAANLHLVEAMFRYRPHLTLLSAGNGEYGLELARRYHPDVILLDIHLPGMDGYAVLQALKASPDTRDIPVIALSADAMPLDVEQGLAAGFQDYLTKPVKLESLMAAVDAVLAVAEET